MPEDLTSAVELPFRHRVRHGVRKPHNWFQLGRFACVGASGYVVNLLVFALCVHVLAIDYKAAAVVACRQNSPNRIAGQNCATAAKETSPMATSA